MLDAQLFKFEKCQFFTNRNIFRHLKLEIALAIPASNEWKTVGLTIILVPQGFTALLQRYEPLNDRMSLYLHV